MKGTFTLVNGDSRFAMATSEAFMRALRGFEGIGRPELFRVVNRVASEVNVSGDQYAYLFRGADGRGKDVKHDKEQINITAQAKTSL